MPAGNDPTPNEELVAAFGVTSNAEELVKVNRSRFSQTLRAAQIKPIDVEATEELKSDLSKVADELGIEEDSIADVAVRGTGAQAAAVVVYLTDRDTLEKDAVPMPVLQGGAEARRFRKSQAASDPDAAAQQAADAKIREAEERAAKIVSDAERTANAKIQEAQEEAVKAIREAAAKAEEERADAAEDAQKAADKARKDAEKDDKSSKQAPKAKPSASAAAGRSGA